MSSIAVIGSGGMLGLAVAEHFRRRGDRVVALSRAEYDIARDPLERLERLLDGCTAAVNCAGVIKPRIAGTPIEDVLKVNAIFPRNLAKLCDRAGRPLVHVTTDCVYSGRKGRYTEDDPFDAEDVYGLSKNAGDAADCMVLRTSIIGEERGQQRSLLEWARGQAGRPVNGFTNHRWNGVTTLHLAEIVAQILDEQRFRKGLFHVHSPQIVTKLELLELIDAAYELKLQIQPAAAPEPCDRSLASIHRLSAEVAVKPLARQLAELRRFFSA
jgi:dTDP-4-dehydrorhamnose reductase